jgi:hypothetical protein
MDLDKVLIKLEKQGWKLEKHFLEVNENFLQDLVDETEKQLNLSVVVPSDCNFYMSGMDTSSKCNNCGKPEHLH